MNLNDSIQSLFPAENDIPERFRLEEPIRQTEYLIDGEIKHWKGDSNPVYSPVCLKNSEETAQKYMGEYPLLTEEAALKALKSSCDAYDHGHGKWPTMPVEDRIKHVEDFLYRMQERRDEVVRLTMWEIGKSLGDSEKEFDRTVAYVRDTIEALKTLDRQNSRFTIEQGVVGQIRRAPLGVVLCMGPYNYPLNETFTTLIPALIMGNTVLFKPPKLGVLLHRPLLEAFQESFPKGVVNSIYGGGKTIVPPLIKSGRVDVLAFIGTSRVANLLKKEHPMPHRMRGVLGLDAKNPGIILKDANLENAVKESVLGALSFNGQRCTALKIFFVQESICNEYLERLKQAVTSLKIGMPWEDAFITPLPESGKTDYLASLLADAKQHGGEVINDEGGMVNRTFFFPAIVYPVSAAMRLYHEEQFGPVIPVVPFKDIKEPVQYIIDSHFGQQVSIFGSDPDLIAKLIDPLVNQVCRVNINSQCQRGPDTFPFTGRKDSAEGTLSVSDALRVFTIRSLVAAKMTDLNKHIFTEIVRERKSNFLSTDYIL